MSGFSGSANAPAAAATLKGNPTNATAIDTDFTIPSLTARGAPDAANDKILIHDNGSGTLKYVTPAQVAAAATAGVSSIAGNTGAFTLGGLLTNATNVLNVTPVTKTDQTTGTSNALAVTPLHQQDHDSAAKASISFTGSTGASLVSFNATSARTSAGVYTVTFATPFASANYVAQVTVNQTSFTSGMIAVVVGKTTSVLSIDVITMASALADAVTVDVVCYGRQ